MRRDLILDYFKDAIDFIIVKKYLIDIIVFVVDKSYRSISDSATLIFYLISVRFSSNISLIRFKRAKVFEI